MPRKLNLLFFQSLFEKSVFDSNSLKEIPGVYSVKDIGIVLNEQISNNLFEYFICISVSRASFALRTSCVLVYIDIKRQIVNDDNISINKEIFVNRYSPILYLRRIFVSYMRNDLMQILCKLFRKA